MKTAPIFSAASAISLLTAGSMVDESIRRVPFFTFLRRKKEKKQKQKKKKEEKKKSKNYFVFFYKNTYLQKKWKVSTFSHDITDY